MLTAIVALIAARAGYLLATRREARRRHVVLVGRIPPRERVPDTGADVLGMLHASITHDTRRRIFAGRDETGRLSA